MRPSLSVRIAESPADKTRTLVDHETLFDLAARSGFQGISMRASVVDVDSPPELVEQVRRSLVRLGLSVSMVTGSAAIAANTSAAATDALHAIEPHLTLASSLGTQLVRVMAHTARDVPVLRRAAEIAGERGITLVHQLHLATLCETTESALDLVRAVGSPNFGITFEPSNLLIAGDRWDRSAIGRLIPFVRNVYFQNCVPDQSGPTVMRMRGKTYRLRYLPLLDPRGVDLHEVVSDLRHVGYQGWFTIHQPTRPDQLVHKAVEEARIAVRSAGLVTDEGGIDFSTLPEGSGTQ